MKWWRNFSFQTQIGIYYLASSICIIGGMGIAIFFSASNIIRGEVENTTKSTIQKGGRQLEMYIDRLRSLSEILAQNPVVIRCFDMKDHQQSNSRLEIADIQKSIKTAMNTNPELASIMMIGIYGQFYSNETNLNMDFIQNMKKQQWYKEAIGNHMPVLTSARMQEFSMDADTWVISIGEDIKNSENKHLGVLRIDLRYQVIESILNDLNLGHDGYAFILNSKNQVVYHKNTDYFKDASKSKELLNLELKENHELAVQNIMKYTYSISNTDWRFVGIASMDGLKRMQQDMMLVLWGLGSIMIIIALLINFFIANSLTSSLRKLENVMKKLETTAIGQESFIFGNEISISGSREIQSLSQRFQSMLIKIHNLIEEIQSQEKTLRISELKILHSQINPHFLYNTLDTIVWLAEFGKTDQVISITQAMAKFFRLSLRGGKETTTLQEELEHVRQYLLIQKERYQEKLTYEIKFDESLLDISIPKIILQPLVENAIYHGIQKISGNGWIKISAYKDEDKFFISVEDNGKGFEKSVPFYPPKDSETHRLGGVGLHNIAERIALYYGEGYGLNIESKEDLGTKIILKLGLILKRGL